MSPRPRPRYAGALESEVRHFFALEFEDPGTEPDDDAVDLESSDARRPSWRLRTPGFAIALASTFAALPIIVVDNLPSSSTGDQAEVATAEVASAEVLAAAPVRARSTRPTTTTVAPTTTTTSTSTSTTTTEGPTAALTPSTEAPQPVVVAAPPLSTTTTTAAPTTTTTTAAPTTTTTTAAPTTTTTTAAPPPANQQSGQASWYSQPSGYAAGGCAHTSLPFGTVVTVSSRGRSVTCTVNDRGPYGAGRIIDLDDDVYAQLAPMSTGVIDVTISW